MRLLVRNAAEWLSAEVRSTVDPKPAEVSTCENLVLVTRLHSVIVGLFLVAGCTSHEQAPRSQPDQSAIHIDEPKLAKRTGSHPVMPEVRDQGAPEPYRVVEMEFLEKLPAITIGWGVFTPHRVRILGGDLEPGGRTIWTLGGKAEHPDGGTIEGTQGPRPAIGDRAITILKPYRDGYIYWGVCPTRDECVNHARASAAADRRASLLRGNE